MEYNQNYENDLNILTKQLNKISLEKSYEKLIEPYKNNPALVKMLHKKNEHLFEEYKEGPTASALVLSTLLASVTTPFVLALMN